MLALNDTSDDLPMRDARSLSSTARATATSAERVAVDMPPFLQMVKAGAALALGAGLVVVVGWFAWLTVIVGALAAFLGR